MVPASRSNVGELGVCTSRLLAIGLRMSRSQLFDRAARGPGVQTVFGFLGDSGFPIIDGSGVVYGLCYGKATSYVGQWSQCCHRNVDV